MDYKCVRTTCPFLDPVSKTPDFMVCAVKLEKHVAGE